MAIEKGVLHYRSWQLSSDDDFGLTFTFHAQFSEIRIIKLFVVLEESHLSSSGSTPDPTHVPMSQWVRSPIFAIASPVQNEKCG